MAQHRDRLIQLAHAAPEEAHAHRTHQRHGRPHTQRQRQPQRHRQQGHDQAGAAAVHGECGLSLAGRVCYGGNSVEGPPSPLRRLRRGTFRARGDTVEIFPIYEEQAMRIELFGDEIDAIQEIDWSVGQILGYHAD